MSSILTTLDIPVFAGQGTTAANSVQTRQQALLDASIAAGTLLLSSCFEAFHAELSSMSDIELAQIGIDIADFKTKEALLELPAERYTTNPVITGTTIFLLQSLRYLAHVEASGVTNDSLTPFSDVLKRNLEYGVGVLGFSSGILPACVVATSLTTISYVNCAVEAYRLAFWIGVRTQLYKEATLIDETSLPWSLVFMGMGKSLAGKAIAKFAEVSLFIVINFKYPF